MTGAPQQDLAQVLGALALELQDQTDTESTLESIVDAAVAVVPGARWAGISLIEGRSVVARVPSDPVVAELDNLQTVIGDGPCITALRDHHTVHVEDMRSESRWPGFSQAAVERGVESMLSFQLFVRQRNLGALNLYANGTGAFVEDSVVIGELLAQHASVALIGSTAGAQLTSAIASRDVIGQAKGLLMYRESLTSRQAFDLLLQTSQNANIKLVDVARWVVEEHEAGIKRS